MAEYISLDVKSQMQRQLQKLINKNIEELMKDIKKTLPSKARAIQGEIYSSYRVIVQNTVEEVFLRTYGDSFDLNSLRSSIIYSSQNDFRPDFSYNESKLVFYSTYMKNFRKFNLNGTQDFRTNRPTHADFNTTRLWDMYNLSESDEYYNDEDSEWEDLMEYYEDINGDLYGDVGVPVNKSLGIAETKSVRETYEEAKTEALRKFNNEYEIHIKPNIEKKYGVKMR